MANSTRTIGSMKPSWLLANLREDDNVPIVVLRIGRQCTYAADIILRHGTKEMHSPLVMNTTGFWSWYRESVESRAKE